MNLDEAPSLLPVRLDSIPAELRGCHQWLVWRQESRPEGRTKRASWTKVPYDARTGSHAATDQPADFCSFSRAVRTYKEHGYSGIGFVFTKDDPYVGIDLDDCRDPVSGRLKLWAAKLIRRLPTYAEVSPSGTGVKLFCSGKLSTSQSGGSRYLLNSNGIRIGKIEIYYRARYFAVTGHRLVDSPVEITDCQQEIDRQWAKIKPAPTAVMTKPAVALPMSSGISDAQILVRARGAANGARFEALWAGDISDYGSHSEADLALCSLLAFWVGPDAERIDGLFRQSNLYRAKWNRRDYRERTISKAISEREEFYSWRPPRREKSSIEIIDASARRTR